MCGFDCTLIFFSNMWLAHRIGIKFECDDGHVNCERNEMECEMLIITWQRSL